MADLGYATKGCLWSLMMSGISEWNGCRGRITAQRIRQTRAGAGRNLLRSEAGRDGAWILLGFCSPFWIRWKNRVGIERLALRGAVAVSHRLGGLITNGPRPLPCRTNRYLHPLDPQLVATKATLTPCKSSPEAQGSARFDGNGQRKRHDGTLHRALIMATHKTLEFVLRDYKRF